MPDPAKRETDNPWMTSFQRVIDSEESVRNRMHISLREGAGELGNLKP
jgi:hypothetical protein